jgi:hypothetical protein
MKNIFYLPITLAAILVCSACNNKMTMKQGRYSSQTLRNIAADKVLLNAFESGNVDSLDKIIAPQFVNHQSIGDLHGLDSLKIMIKAFHSRMGTVKLELKRRLADEEFVSDWVRFTTTNSPVGIEGMEVTRYVDGKAVEHFWFPNGQASKK